ncbi:MAG: CPBP family intramembrane metalloprotease [Chloroflexi bacterium]|nr:CPBP family intramembrane metalloprotease [Chloroflexota bacterium]
MTETQTPPKRSLLAAIFLSPDEPRLRAGWRLLIQTILFITLMFLIGIPVGLIAYLIHGDVSGTAYFIANMIVELFGVTLSVYLARRFLDKRTFTSLGFKLDKYVLLDIVAGIGITFIMMGSIFAAMWALGWLKFESFAWDTEPLPRVVFQTLAFLFIFILVGWNEELLSRGYHLQTIASGMNLFWGVVISSAVFGLLHLGNPNATWVSAAGIFFAGLFLAYGYVRTKQLWLSIGLHIGWNFFEGVGFGFPVSGLDIYPLTHITVSGPEIWTGGAFGPEAGLIVLPALALGAALIYLYSRSRLVS